MLSPELLKKITHFEVDFDNKSNSDICRYYYQKTAWYGKTITVQNEYVCERIASVNKNDDKFVVYSQLSHFQAFVKYLSFHMNKLHEGYEYVHKRDLERENKMDLI